MKSGPRRSYMLPFVDSTPDAFLCSVNDVTVANTIDQRPRHGVAGAEVMLRQKLVGQGLAFIVAGGSRSEDMDNLFCFKLLCITHAHTHTHTDYFFPHHNPTNP